MNERIRIHEAVAGMSITQGGRGMTLRPQSTEMLTPLHMLR